ncbi:hypothetical protein BDZ45DRAFT_687597 [Acephala macrosclerotiorum]|nr:hypothetical protein BDZ45DRAFT_687597 [Acephala macrosclerotiorum]
MAKRVAFFEQYDVSFLCGAGHWREALHSGKFGHDARIFDIDLLSHGSFTLSVLGWLRTTNWDFRDYDAVLLEYSQRTLSYESDKLNAISGCLDLLAQKKGIYFLVDYPLLISITPCSSIILEPG